MTVPLIGQQPQPQKFGGFRHIYGEPNPSPHTATQVVPGANDKGEAQVVFLSSGGMTTFESAAMSLAGQAVAGCAHASGYIAPNQIDEIAEQSVRLAKSVFDQCRKVVDPYQGTNLPEGQDEPDAPTP